MADRTTYPSIPARIWWDLRRRAQTSPPTKVDPDYLQSVLGVQEGHATNLISPLTAVGLIDDAGKLTPLGENWRHDDTYSESCNQILESVYPQALRDAFPPPKPDRSGVEKWFARNAHVGSAAAQKMATTYLFIAAADPAGGAAQPRPEGAARKPQATKRTGAAPRERSRGQTGQDAGQAAAAAGAAASAPNAGRSEAPSIHVDVQVHISPDASADQIDAIFASMSKHLYPERG
jgi:hypothetical protein